MLAFYLGACWNVVVVRPFVARRTSAGRVFGRQKWPVTVTVHWAAGNSCRISTNLLQNARRCVLFKRSGHGTPAHSEAFSQAAGAEMSRYGLRAACVMLLVIPAVFGTACVLVPDSSGMGTHRQLGLPPCTFLNVTGLVCPQCGLTTSFALLVRGRIGEALWANPAGPVLAVMLAAVWPWLLVSVVSRRWYLSSDPAGILLKLVIGWFLLTLAQWVPRIL